MRKKSKRKDEATGSPIIKILSIMGVIITAITVLTPVVSGWIIWKFVRYMDTAQRSLPTIEKASSLYLRKNADTDDVE